MNHLTLYMAPGTCARVPCILLEEAGADFETQVIRFMRGEHKAPPFKAINPKGKVPALTIDGQTLSENIAIITYLAARFPAASLLPEAGGDLDRARQLADLSWCAATMHPVVTRIRLPGFFATEAATRTVWKKGCEAMDEHFQLVEDQLASGDWWYGASWSAMDAYLYWIFWRVESAGYDVSRFPRYCEHKARSEQRPAVERALAREKKAENILENEGLLFTPPPVP